MGLMRRMRDMSLMDIYHPPTDIKYPRVIFLPDLQFLFPEKILIVFYEFLVTGTGDAGEFEVAFG